MTRRPSVVWLNGSLLPYAEATISVEDRGLQFGESLYEVVPFTAGRPRLLAEHAARMRAGAEAIGLVGAPKLDEWEALARALGEEEGIDEALLYAQITGGTAPRAHLVDSPPPATFFAYLSRHRFPRADDVARGIAAITLIDPRWARRDLKTTMLLPSVMAKRSAQAKGAAEALFVGTDGLLHEGAASNVFVVEGRTLVTPVQSERLLPGTTRPLVGSLAKAAGFEATAAELSLERVGRADEVFVTSTALLLMPVVSIDGKPVGNGRAGPIAADLALRLRRRLELDER